jgi:mRNA-degrading endonuclease RelE of RelBE toxin-antitoxin system
MPEWRVEYMPHVMKYDIPSLSAPVAKMIEKAINEKLRRNPIAFSKPLQHSLRGQRRLRCGDYRVIFVLNQELSVIRVTAIAHRRYVYS